MKCLTIFTFPPVTTLPEISTGIKKKNFNSSLEFLESNICLSFWLTFFSSRDFGVELLSGRILQKCMGQK